MRKELLKPILYNLASIVIAGLLFFIYHKSAAGMIKDKSIHVILRFNTPLCFLLTITTMIVATYFLQQSIEHVGGKRNMLFLLPLITSLMVVFLNIFFMIISMEAAQGKMSSGDNVMQDSTIPTILHAATLFAFMMIEKPIVALRK